MRLREALAEVALGAELALQIEPAGVRSDARDAPSLEADGPELGEPDEHR